MGWKAQHRSWRAIGRRAFTSTWGPWARQGSLTGLLRSTALQLRELCAEAHPLARRRARHAVDEVCRSEVVIVRRPVHVHLLVTADP